MRILMLTSNSSLQDGINRHILSVAPALQALNGVEVAVCTVQAAGEFNHALEQKGLKTFSLSLPNGHSLRTWGRFSRVLREFNPDLIHAQVMGLMERLYLGVFRPRLPIVGTCHGLSDHELGLCNKGVRIRLEEILYHVTPGRIWKTIFISKGVARAKGVPDAVVAYNPVEFNETAAQKGTNILRTELGLVPDTPVIGTACRISLPKQPKIFVSVMCAVLREMPDVHAVVCGTSQDPSLMQELEQQVRASGVSERFHWLGYRKDAPQITRELNCFVMTSATEGMPTALLEAMSAKTPIAFLRGRGGLVDLNDLNEEDGPFAVVSNADDLEGFVRGIVGVLQNPEKAHEFSERAFRVGAHHFAIERTRDQLISVYRTFCAR